MQTQELPLKGIHLPDPITWWPLAPGWWLLGFLVLALLILVGWCAYRAYHHRKAKRIALAQYKQLAANEASDSAYFQLLKRAAMAYFQRDELAALHGQSLAQFLLAQLPEKRRHTSEEELTLWLDNIYRDKPQSSGLEKFTQHWLTRALPPKRRLG